ncbi:glucokinase [Tengunoibacter tsumagoiensis]|uniref:Glucokinase n=1 Tax=Tengunoibacter tsumagoiensis TaxID=2014871 RepID=A0A402A9T5_9CHLR|nr:glucokinase [Tengunoibacter tsumagoiensis]GCE15944.1 glucokinase [Tengunoibacter tsumagoiensis]
MLLAGDIGGTKTNLAVFSSKDELRKPLYAKKFPSAQYTTLAALVTDFLSEVDLPIDRAVFGVAGPVLEGKAKITNLPWVMEENQLQSALKIPTIRLINDLAATAQSIPALEPADLHTLNAGEPMKNGTMSVVAPGTGLGEAFLVWDGSKYAIYPSEGGHADFAPTNAFEVGLLVYMLERLPHVSYEHVCSGIGLPNIYAYIKESGMFVEPEWLSEKLANAADRTPVIADGAMAAEPAPICMAALKSFAAILGAEAGNMAIKVLSTGGVYLGGGIPPRILPFLESDDFMRAFRNKGRFSNMLGNVPVHVILRPDAGLIGAAAYGFNML